MYLYNVKLWYLIFSLIKYFWCFQARKTLNDQINKLFPSEDGLPDLICLVNTGEHLGNQLVTILQERQYKVMGLSGSSDIRTGVTFLVNKMQKLWVIENFWIHLSRVVILFFNFERLENTNIPVNFYVESIIISSWLINMKSKFSVFSSRLKLITRQDLKATFALGNRILSINLYLFSTVSIRVLSDHLKLSYF